MLYVIAAGSYFDGSALMTDGLESPALTITIAGMKECESMSLMKDTLYLATENDCVSAACPSAEDTGRSRVYKIDVNHLDGTGDITFNKGAEVLPLVAGPVDSVHATLPTDPLSKVTAKSPENCGVEAMTVINEKDVIQGYECELIGDDENIFRLVHRELATGNVKASFVIHMPADPHARKWALKELVSVGEFHDVSLTGMDMLALFTTKWAFQPEEAQTNHVQVLRLRITAATTDVKMCDGMKSGSASGCDPNSNGFKAVEATVVFDWDCGKTVTDACNGEAILHTGNYEGMAVLPNHVKQNADGLSVIL